MRMKKMMISIIVIMLLVFAFVPQDVYAESFFETIKNQARAWIEAGEAEGNNIITEQELQDKFIPIGQVLISIATIVIFSVTAVMGIKYILASAEEKGKLKQQLIGLVVSIIVIYGSVGIWSAVQTIMGELDI